ncbi:hypothetical protein DPMN_022411 [Dreissena polymorpha]|uniref:Uncharacterized protein n=1 Tax=Dreissena polymorpha TaxID=45954 RepID=A0A9D4NMG8_DREPO|nr:hypothetical protein DPMN_022411 [Dreissena polymorpha]
MHPDIVILESRSKVRVKGHVQALTGPHSPSTPASLTLSPWLVPIPQEQTVPRQKRFTHRVYTLYTADPLFIT